MNEKGADRPSRKIVKRKREPGGVSVKPGTYKVKIEYGEMSDETTIEVKSDPRLTVSAAAINDVYAQGKKLESFMQTAADAVKQLVESKNIANRYQGELKKLDKEKYKDAIESSKSITKKIDSIVAIYIGKEDKRQGITRNPEMNVMTRINGARRYVLTRKTGITDTEQELIGYAEQDLKAALDSTNAFFTNDWNAYREEIEKLEASPFKETKSFSLE
jgi:hypothetical protein